MEKVGPKGTTVCSRRLQRSTGARKKPPVGRQFFLVMYKVEKTVNNLFSTIGVQMTALKMAFKICHLTRSDTVIMVLRSPKTANLWCSEIQYSVSGVLERYGDQLSDSTIQIYFKV